MRALISNGKKARRLWRGSKGPERLSIEAEILGALQELEQMRIEQLVRALPCYTWREVFRAVEVLRRDAVLTVTQSDELSCWVSLNRAGH